MDVKQVKIMKGWSLGLVKDQTKAKWVEVLKSQDSYKITKT